MNLHCCFRFYTKAILACFVFVSTGAIPQMTRYMAMGNDSPPVRSTNSDKSVHSSAFRVGTGCVDVSPKTFPVLINGGFTPRFVSKVDDPLHARALVVDDGNEQFAFCVIDNCEMAETVASEIKRIVHEKTGLSPQRISISATHCHSAPSLIAELACYPDANYVKYLPPLAAQAIINAYESRQSARFGWITVHEPRFVFCRRFLMQEGTASSPPHEFTGVTQDRAQMNPGKSNKNKISPTGFPDQSLYLLAFETLDHKPLGLLANYSTHYAGGVQNVSADYFGVFCSKIGSLLGANGNFNALMTNGTSGDTNCSDFRNPNQPAFDLHIVGTALAEQAAAAWKNIHFVDHAKVVAMEEPITLKIRKPTSEQVVKAKEWLDNLKKQGKKVQTTTDVYAFETVNTDALPPERTLQLQVVRIGDLGLCAIPCEVFSFTGHDLRANTPLANNIVLGLTNGYNGYIPTADQFILGGYTTWRARGSILEEEAEPKIRAKLLDMLNRAAAVK